MFKWVKQKSDITGKLEYYLKRKKDRLYKNTIKYCLLKYSESLSESFVA